MGTDQSIDTVQYYRSAIVSHEPSTMVYWAEDAIGRSWDVLKSDLPEGASVIDVTYDALGQNPKFVVNRGILERVI